MKKFTKTRNKKKPYRQFIKTSESDPLSGVANLFDVAMVFAVALIIMIFNALHVPELLNAREDVTIVKNPGQENMEIITKKGVKLETYRMTDKDKSGTGTKLGICYKLSTGEVIYVPEEDSKSTQ
jgi:hypothetical protein